MQNQREVALRVRVAATDERATQKFNVTTRIFDVMKRINTSMAGNQPDLDEYGLMLRNEQDPSQDRWLDNGRNINYYRLRNGDLVELRKRFRPQKIKLTDGTVKLVKIDDSDTVGELVVSICKRIGITNHEEFSLQVEGDGDGAGAAAGGGSPAVARKESSRRKSRKEDKKMEKLKKKLKTEDDVDWLNHEQTLHEQGVTPDMTLLLRKKYFFSDLDLDKSDPLQVSLLYVQSRDAIIDGTHPCTQEEACEFAGMQLHVDFGDFNAERHKPGFIDNLRSVLPAEYAKTKNIEKKVLDEWSRLQGQPELNVKFQYIRNCRALKTYGVTFFLVKEKVKGKNKLVPRLLGITRESIMRVDERTKEVIKQWPLTTVRRWAASPNSFTLDFGDYSDSYYAVQTTEAEPISQLIAGYIDIILKDKKKQDRRAEAGLASASEEEVASPKSARAARSSAKVQSSTEHSIAHESGQATTVTSSGDTHIYGTVPQRAVASESVGPVGQRAQLRQPPAKHAALTATIDRAKQSIQQAASTLGSPARLPPLGSDVASMKWRRTTHAVACQNVAAHVQAVTAAASSATTLTAVPPGSPVEVDLMAVAACVSTVSSNLVQLAGDARMTAALDSGNAATILSNSKSICSASLQLLDALLPVAQGSSNRQELLGSATSTGAAASGLLALLGGEQVDARTQEILHSLAKLVASETSKLISHAKTVAGRCPDPVLQNSVIVAAKATAMSTSQLITCTKLLAPTIDSPLCKEQLIECARQVAEPVEAIVSASQHACSDAAVLFELGESATAVTNALGQLIRQTREGAIKHATKQQLATAGAQSDSPKDKAAFQILQGTDALRKSASNPQEIVKHAKALAQATAMLVTAIKAEAAEATGANKPGQQQHLLGLARALGEATSKMVSTAKAAAQHPDDRKNRQALRAAAAELQRATNAAAGDALRKQKIGQLEMIAKQTASVCTQLLSAAQGSAASNRNPASQHMLIEQCKQTAAATAELVDALLGYQSMSDSASAQLQLINACRGLLGPGQKTVTAAKAAVPTVTDPAAALQLSSFAKSAATAFIELRGAMQATQETLAPLELDSAANVVRGLKLDVAECTSLVQAGQLVALPGESAQDSVLSLSSSCKALGASVGQLHSAVNQKDVQFTGVAAREVSNSLKALCAAVRAVAATHGRESDPSFLLQCTEALVGDCEQMLTQATLALSDESKLAALEQSVRTVHQSIAATLSCLPGQREVDQALEAVAAARQALKEALPKSSGGQMDAVAQQRCQQSLATLASGLNSAAGALAAMTSRSARASDGSAGIPGLDLAGLQAQAREFAATHQDLMAQGRTLAQSLPQAESKELLAMLRVISSASTKFLFAGKSVAAEPDSANIKNQLAAAVKGLTSSINGLLETCSSSGPGQIECDNAVRTMQAALTYLDAPNAPLSDMTFFNCFDTVMDQSKQLGAAMAGIANQARQGNEREFGEAVGSAAAAVVAITEAAAQAAYLAAISDPSTTPAEPGLLDQTHVALAEQGIQGAMQTLLNPNSKTRVVTDAAVELGRHTGYLAASCKQAAHKTSNSVAKKRLVGFVRIIASSTKELVDRVKALAVNPGSAEHREACATGAGPLLAAVEELRSFAQAPEFASKPAQISDKARQTQAPVVAAAREVNQASSNLVLTAKSLMGNAKSSTLWQQLSAHSKEVSAGIKGLVSAIRDSTPGQVECDAAIFTTNEVMNELDHAALASTLGTLPMHQESTLQGFQEQLLECLSGLGESIERVGAAAKCQPEKLAHAVQALANMFQPLQAAAVGAASRLPDREAQGNLLERTKTVAESALDLLHASREASGNADAVDLHPAVDEAVRNMRAAVTDLAADIGGVAGGEQGLVGGLVSTINMATQSMEAAAGGSSSSRSAGAGGVGGASPTGGRSVDDDFSHHQARVTAMAKELGSVGQTLMAKGLSDPSQLGELSQQLAQLYADMAGAAKAASATTDDRMGDRLRTAVRALGAACADLVQTGSVLQGDPGDRSAKREFVGAARALGRATTEVRNVLEASARGTQACINASEAVEAMLVDLETSALFASAGSASGERQPKGAFDRHRKGVLAAAKDLVGDTKTLVNSATATQEELAAAAEQALATFAGMTESMREAAQAVGASDGNAQVLLLNAARDVATALSSLLLSTKSAVGHEAGDPALESMKADATAMVTSLSSLVKTVQSVEDKHAQVERAVAASLEAIDADLSVLSAGERPSNMTATPEELLRSTQGITQTIAELVAAMRSGKAEAVTAAANRSRETVSAMIQLGRSAAFASDVGTEGRMRVLQGCADCALAVKDMLLFYSNAGGKVNDQASTRKTLDLSRTAAAAVKELVAASEELRGEEWVNPNDPNVAAEAELKGAAAAIELAAERLAELELRPATVKEFDPSMEFHEIVLEGAKGIAGATKALVRAAAKAQRELGGKDAAEAAQWSSGLVSAAKRVALQTSALCEAANATVEGGGGSSDEKLVASAKGVNKTVAQLLVACRVKGSAETKAMARVLEAGKLVRASTEKLVVAAQEHRGALDEDEDEDQDGESHASRVSAMRKEIEAQEAILAHERKLEEAKKELLRIRKGRTKWT